MATELSKYTPSERLQKAMSAGDVLSLFPLLADWPDEELRALIADAEEYCSKLDEAINLAHREMAFRPENFFSRERSAAIDLVTEQKDLDTLAMGAEIISVALFYLHD